VFIYWHKFNNIRKEDDMKHELVFDTKTDIEKLVGNFNQWADERIVELNTCPLSLEIHQRVKVEIDTLNWAKKNLARLAKEVLKK